MKIRVEPGRVIRLDRRRATSSAGGVYDISQLSEVDQKRVLAAKGVTQIDAAPAKAPAKKGGDK